MRLMLAALMAVFFGGCASGIRNDAVDRQEPEAVIMVQAPEGRVVEVLKEWTELRYDEPKLSEQDRRIRLLAATYAKASVEWHPSASGTQIEVRSMSPGVRSIDGDYAKIVGKDLRETFERKQIAFTRVR